MKIAIVLVITLALAAGPLYGEVSEQPPPEPAQEQPEVLTSGPVHEAFAEPVVLKVQAGLTAPTQPPANIVENPPADRPEGEQFIWVPGYWAWDSERSSYIWVSGCWRAAPPNMYWVPGYWAKVPEGWEWVAGFWTPVTGAQQIEYLPAPPALEEMQPQGNQPSPDTIWVPPCWYWYQNQYVLRSGYWLAAQPDWLWAPSHYVWTPRGYVFVGGHWDYPLEHRGVLFAPVYFPRPVYERAGFSYSSSVVIDIGTLQLSLFTCPRYSHYYFGDYYDDAYIGIGIYPFFERKRHYTWYDPIYEYDRWHLSRTDPSWEEHKRSEYDLRRTNKDLRPPRTYNEMVSRVAKLPEPQRRNLQMAQTLTAAVVAGKATQLKFEHINNNARNKLTTQTTDMRKFREERSRWEVAPAGQKTVQPPSGYKGTVTPLTEHRESVTPSIERKEPATSFAAREPTFVPPREVRLTGPERVNIPSSPIADRRGVLSIFRKGPPSRPVGEQKADVKDTRRDSDTRTDSDATRDRDQRRGGHN